MNNLNILGTSANILNLESKMSLKLSLNKTNQRANTKSLFFFPLSKKHLCSCVIQVLGDAFSSIVSAITPMAACPKLIPLIVDSEYNCSFRGRHKFSSPIKYRFYCT